MDEPTSSLTIAETERLLRVIAGLKSDGVSVIFISHRLGEVERCADRVVVLRDGRVAGALERSEIEPRGDDPADDRTRAQRQLHRAGAPAGRRSARDHRPAHHRLPGPGGHAARAAGRDPRPGRPGGLRPHRTGPRRVRHRPAAGRHGARGRAADRRRLAARGDRARPVPRARGPQALGAAARRADRREHLAAQPAGVRARG